MANLVEFLVKLNDMASGPLQKLGNVGNTTFSKMQSGLTNVASKFSTLGMNITQIDAKLTQLQKTRAISMDGSQIRRINSEISALQAKKDRLEGRSSNGGIGGMLRTGLMIAGVGSLALIGKDIMQAGIGRQMDLTAMEVLAGKGPGDRLNSQLVDFAKKSIYGNEVFNEGKLMVGSGVKANNVMPVLKMIGDIAMGDNERMKSIALAFSEASSTGYLTGRQEMMMRTALFNPLEQMKHLDKFKGHDLKKDMEKGKISIDDLVKSMEYATGPMGRWHDMMLKMQSTPAGKWTAFTGTVRTLAGTIGLALLPALGHVTDFLTALINNAPMLYGVATAIGVMTVAWEAYTLWTERAAIWQGILAAAAYWPIALIGVIAGAIAYLCAQDDKYADNAVGNAQRVNDGFSILRRTFEDIGYWAESAWLYIASFLERTAPENILKGPKGFWKSLTGDTEAGQRLEKLQQEHTWNRAMDLAGMDKDGKPKGAGKSPLDILSGKYDYGKTGAAGLEAGDTSKAITGGGVRNITINVAKFQDKTEIHTSSFKESVSEAEDMLRNMFERIVNSAAAQLT